MRNLIIVAVLGLLVACATGPKVRTDYDHAANFASYRTYNFAPELGTDRGGYSTIVTGHFKRAVAREMESRGYTLATDKPDLLVNFYTSVRERTEVNSSPRFTFGAGYYGYRYGLYTAWPLYDRDITTTQQQVGTANVDVVDASRKQLIWEGRTEGRLTEGMLDEPGPAIDKAVAALFTKYPARSGSAPQ